MELNDLNSDENLLLEDLDSYWNELNDRLTVSRMVNDSIIRGIMNAVSQDAMDLVSSKEDEISRLKARLHVYESGKIIDTESVCTFETDRKNSARAQIHIQTLKTGIKALMGPDSCGKKLRLNVLTEMNDVVDALNMLIPKMSNDSDGKEIQWEFEREICSIILRDFMKALREEQTIFLHNQIRISDIEVEHRSEKIIGLMGLVQELDSMNSIFSSFTSEMDSELRKEKPMACNRTEWNRLKRQLESSLHEKTEELFRLKREILNEKGSFWHKRGKFTDVLLEVEKYFPFFDLKSGHQKEIPSVNLEKLKDEISDAGGKFFAEVESRLDEQKGHLDRVVNEFNFVSVKLMSSVASLDEAICQNQKQEAKLCELNHRLVCTSDALDEAKRENANLCQTIQHRESEILSASGRLDERERVMESILKHVHEFSSSIDEFQSCILSRVQVRNGRY